MINESVLKGKRILAVDDEPDVLEVIKEQLSGIEVMTADTFDRAQRLIDSQRFDLVILDIMGVNGFDLLKSCRDRKMPAAMLTARAVNVESVNRSLKLGAVSFLPKEELPTLRELVAEILEDLERGESHWKRLFDRLGPMFKEKFGIIWEDLEKPGPPIYYG
ncbi:MAG: response regulator [Desulfomonile tiedjei]|nr:response regulator [Desulfomonile tiedjei]